MNNAMKTAQSLLPSSLGQKVCNGGHDYEHKNKALLFEFGKIVSRRDQQLEHYNYNVRAYDNFLSISIAVACSTLSNI